MALIPKRPYELQSYLPEVDLITPPTELVLMIDHQSWPEPKRFPFDLNTTIPDWADATQEAILTLLGVDTVVSLADLVTILTPYALKEDGKSLLLDTEITRLSTLKQNVYTLSFPSSSDVSGRITGSILPEGWAISVGESSVDLLITHGQGRRIANATVFSINGNEETLLAFGAGYTGLKSLNENSVLIMGLTQMAVPIKIYLTLV